jgi:DNA-binding SARP family transcriptional activator
VGVAYRVLGPLEALVEGRPAALGAPRHRALLVLLLAQANAVVPVHRLIDEIWGDAPPASAANLVQGAVSHLRKVLGRDAIVTRGAGYVVTVAPNALDLHRFERLAEEGSLALEQGGFEEAAAALAAALDLWFGPALADLNEEPCVQPIATRLDELRLLASERWLEAELGRGRHGDVLPDLRDLVSEHPLRERAQPARPLWTTPRCFGPRAERWPESPGARMSIRPACGPTCATPQGPFPGCRRALRAMSW